MAEVRSFGRVKVILGKKNGKYPYGNSILYRRDSNLSLRFMCRLRALPVLLVQYKERASYDAVHSSLWRYVDTLRCWP